mgnify:FL=1|tara:strand:- start:264 stop:656 length:393 start_codon:yes stop_codon:yes gene_type:complete
MDDSFFKDIFSFKNIAVVGLSPNSARPSNYVSKYMLENGYNIIPVNPGYKSIFNIECFPSLDSIPYSIDIVNVFRNSKYVLPIIKDALFIKSKVIWLQDGVESNEGKILALKSGVKFVSNDCILRRHRSL